MGLDQGWTLRGVLCPFPDAIPSLPHTPVILCPGLNLTAPSPLSGQTPTQHPQVNIGTLSEDSDEERPPPKPPGRREALQLQPYCILGSPTPPPPHPHTAPGHSPRLVCCGRGPVRPWWPECSGTHVLRSRASRCQRPSSRHRAGLADPRGGNFRAGLHRRGGAQGSDRGCGRRESGWR